MIQQHILTARGATCRKYEKDQTIFFEGDSAFFYYQVAEGSVRMVNIYKDGREFIQGIFKREESFGEPVLFIDEPYPATAIANEPSVILRLTKDQFLQLLKDCPEISLNLNRILAQRLYNKSLLSKEIAGENPGHRIITLLRLLKQESRCNEQERFKIELSRQRIANMTGLRIETVIRVMRKLYEKGELVIEKRKVYI